MADDPDSSDKTEDPSQKRLDEALKRGDVVKSQEVNTWFVIAGATLVLMAFSGGMGESLTTTMRGLIANSHDIRMDGPALPRLFQKIGLEMIAAVAIPFLLLMLAALFGNVIQHQLVWSFEAIIASGRCLSSISVTQSTSLGSPVMCQSCGRSIPACASAIAAPATRRSVVDG